MRRLPGWPEPNIRPCRLPAAAVEPWPREFQAVPEIREAKVQSLQQAIGNGEYSVPASLVADALVSEHGGARG